MSSLSDSAWDDKGDKGFKGDVEVTDGGSVHVIDGFRPSAYATDLTMDGTAQAVALATGAARIRVTNRGATTEDIRVAFGTSEANAQENLNIAAAAATTGYWIGAAADGHQATQVLVVPANATHYAVANGTASDTQKVSVEQGA